jgi:hypothetical protein
VDAIIDTTEESLETCCTLVAAETLPKDKQVPYGEVVKAWAKLRGKVLIVSITRDQERDELYPLVPARAEVLGLTLQRFYELYFGPVMTCGETAETSQVPLYVSLDRKQKDHDPLLVGKCLSILSRLVE